MPTRSPCYTVDARGSRASASTSAEYSNLSASEGGRVNVDSLRDLSLQEPLVELAERTGGSSVLSTFNFSGAFDRMGTDFDRFYSLGYQPANRGDDKYHKIEVNLLRPGLKVRHRSGYVDKPRAARSADRTLSSLILDLEKNPLDVVVEFGVPEKKGRRWQLPVLVKVPFRQVTLLPSGETHKGALKVFIGVKDEKGQISDLFTTTYPVEVPEGQIEAAMTQELGYFATLEVRGGKQRVAVGVLDEVSGIDSFVHKDARVSGSKKRRG